MFLAQAILGTYVIVSRFESLTEKSIAILLENSHMKIIKTNVISSPRKRLLFSK